VTDHSEIVTAHSDNSAKSVTLISEPPVTISESPVTLFRNRRSRYVGIRTMTTQRFGRIVNIGGEAWRNGLPFHTLLAGVGKGSMVGLTVTLAGETVRDGITVNCVSPGAVESTADGSPPSTICLVRDVSWTGPDVMNELGRLSGPRYNFISRPAHPTEVASAVAYFGSPEASYVTGQHIGVSGGMVML